MRDCQIITALAHSLVGEEGCPQDIAGVGEPRSVEALVFFAFPPAPLFFALGRNVLDPLWRGLSRGRFLAISEKMEGISQDLALSWGVRDASFSQIVGRTSTNASDSEVCI